MAERDTASETATPDGTEAARAALHRLVTIAWLAILLGFVMQALIIAGQMAGGAPPPGPPALANVAQGVTWSLIVCMGVGIAMMVMRSSVALAGVIGFVSAPLALGGARGMQRGVNQMMGGPEEQFITLAVLLIALIKAMEYGFLTIMLSRLMRLGKETLRPYLALGAATGLVFGGAIVTTSWYLASLAGPGMARAALTGMLINELLFPIGCVMVIYAIQFIGRQTRAIQSAAEAKP